MSRGCSICLHPRVQGIDAALLAGRRTSEISRQFQVHDDALRRHRIAEHHLPAEEADAAEAMRVVAKADDVSIGEFAKELRLKAASLLLKAETSGRLAVALQGVREARACLELEGKLEGELAHGPTMNVNVSTGSDNLQVAVAVLRALTPFPEARAAVLAALAGFNGMQIEGDALPAIEAEG